VEASRGAVEVQPGALEGHPDLVGLILKLL
jgi:hypothetical protein